MIITTALRPLRVSLALLPVSALVASAGLLATPRAGAPATLGPDECAPGYRLVDRADLIAEARLGELGTERAKSHDQMLDPVCLSTKHPERFAEISRRDSQRVAAATAPLGVVPPGAFRAAVRQHEALLAQSGGVPGSNGSWRPVGQGPLIVNSPDFPEVNGLGLAKNSGRIDSLDYDEQDGLLFASIGTGGVWVSDDLGDSWTSIGDDLPTQVIGAVAWSEAGGGTLVAVSGEPLMGGNTNTGLGAFWSDDLGTTWHQSSGVPDGAMGFQVAVHPLDEREIFLATSQGLFRSTDAGRTFEDAMLPTGDCAGSGSDGEPYDECQFANFVTDVVIQEPGGSTGVPGGRVVAAVGYRAGSNAFFDDGTVHAAANGIYASDSGAPGSFAPTAMTGFAEPRRRGRTEFGAAIGADQDHNYLYAINEDAFLFECGVTAIDAPEPVPDIPEDPVCSGVANTTFGGIYVSADFGETWVEMADTTEVAENPTTHSGLTGVGQALLFAPGVQAWYNMWIKPDPTVQDADGVPTRLAFGLEEVWANRCPNPQNSANQDTTCDLLGGGADPEVGDFEVRGPYFADESCLLLATGVQECPPAEDFTNPPLTTHPDQHDALWIPDGQGGVDLIIGNDGGAYRQHIEAGGEIDPGAWGEGHNEGFHTLLPYSAEVAKDGTVWFGLQDNGSGKITPGDETHYETIGGDGFFAAVDPDNSDYAWSEYTFAGMSVTTDGGTNWRSAAPDDEAPGTQFSNPFVMDPTDANHLMTAGRTVVETTYGPETDIEPGDDQAGDAESLPCAQNCWEVVFDLGTLENPGVAPDPVAENLLETGNSMSAIDLYGDAAYVGFCGVCDIHNNQGTGFHSGLATNVGGDTPPERMTSNGWHIATADGLPNRFITSIAIDPSDPSTVFVTLGGYNNREWVPPGSYLDPNEDIGEGHVFMSTDAGETFTDISGDLPDTTTTWVETRDDQLVVGSDLGVYLSGPIDGTGTPEWAVLDGLPRTVVSTIRNHPGDFDKIIVATFGRGVYEYDFGLTVQPTESPSATPTATGSPTGSPSTSPSPSPGVVPTGGETTSGDTPTTGGGSAGLAVAALIGAAVLGHRATRRRVR